MNLKVIIPDNWQKEGFNEWVNKINKHVKDNKYEED